MKFIFFIMTIFSNQLFAQEIDVREIQEIKLVITEFKKSEESYGSESRYYTFEVTIDGDNAFKRDLHLICSQLGNKSSIGFFTDRYIFPIEHQPERPPELTKTFCKDLAARIQTHLSLGQKIAVTLSYPKKEVVSIKSFSND